MSDIGMVSEFRTDFDCKVIGLPSEMWAECQIQIEGSDDFHFEIIAEKNRMCFWPGESGEYV